MKDFENGYSNYQNLLMPFIIKYAQASMKMKQKDPSYSRPRNDFDSMIVDGFNEINSAYETLKFTELLIKLSPPRSNKIEKNEYLNYHIHHYLQEVYILKERLITYAKQIMRTYNKIIDKKIIDSTMKLLMTLVSDFLKDFTDVRGKHVHTARYTDEVLQDLTLYSLTAQHHKEFIPIERIAYNKAKHTWIELTKKTNNDISKLLDIYFSTLDKIVFKDGKVLTPNKTE